MSRKKRLNLLVDAALLQWVRWYAAQNHTSISELVREHFRNLKSEYENSSTGVPQF